jgi:ATP-dependent DNA helicase RecG
MAPLRVAHDLKDRQRQILQAVAGGRERQFANIRAQIGPAVADRILRDDLIHLKRLGLINSCGHGRGAVWFLAVESTPDRNSNKAE